jgi:hypothetical protein
MGQSVNHRAGDAQPVAQAIVRLTQFVGHGVNPVFVGVTNPMALF